jgi:hypothetical protein
LKRRHEEFHVGDHVYLKVKERRSSLKLGNYANFSPRFCGPLEILAQIRPMAYQLAFPANLKVHNVFHVSSIGEWCRWNQKVSSKWNLCAFCTIKLWKRAIVQVKVQSKHFSPEEATWELEEDLQKSYLALFQERNEN